MQYRLDRYGNPISVLGFGCMRFPMGVTGIDKRETEKEILYAMEEGINYFDTAYVYPGSESVLGEILEKNGCRARVSIATKLPHYLIRSREALERMFREQLRHLRTDYIDYYLMHMLSDVATWDRLCAMGIEDWIREKKEKGEIRQIGFSYHGNSEMFCRLLDVYDWDFCQIQYNYMDENTQAGRRGLQYAAQKGIPVIIMEPLRGGKLVSRLPEAAKKIFASHDVKESPAHWAFSWLWDQKDVTCVLSGMNSMDMIRENIRTANVSHAGCLRPEDQEMLRKVSGAINAKMKVPCTGCGYCMPCHKGVDIPATFAAWNRKYAEGTFWGVVEYAMCTLMRRDFTAASNCIACGACSRHCPQGIDIPTQLAQARRELEGPVYRAARKVIGWWKPF